MNLAYESCKYSRKAPHFLSEIIFINMGVMASHTCVVIDQSVFQLGKKVVNGASARHRCFSIFDCQAHMSLEGKVTVTSVGQSSFVGSPQSSFSHPYSQIFIYNDTSEFGVAKHCGDRRARTHRQEEEHAGRYSVKDNSQSHILNGAIIASMSFCYKYAYLLLHNFCSNHVVAYFPQTCICFSNAAVLRSSVSLL